MSDHEYNIHRYERGVSLYKEISRREERGKLALREAHAPFSRFKEVYKEQGHEKGHVIRKLAAIPGALTSFLIKAPTHILQSAYHLGKSVVTGKMDRERSHSDILKVARDLEEGVGGLALLINDKFGCYLISEAQYNKQLYDEALDVIEHPEKMQEREGVTEQEAMGEFGKLPADMIQQIFKEAGAHTLEASKALKEAGQLKEDSSVWETEYRELTEQLTWANDYIDHMGLSDKPIREKVKAISLRLKEELGELDQYEEARRFLESLPARPHPDKLIDLVKEMDEWLEDFNYQLMQKDEEKYWKKPPINYMTSTRLFGWKFQQMDNRRGAGLTRIPKGFLKDHPDIEALRFYKEKIFFIPKEIGQLQKLKALGVDGFYTYLPKEIGQLQSLEKLFLGKNLEALPDEIVNLEKLWFLDIVDVKDPQAISALFDGKDGLIILKSITGRENWYGTRSSNMKSLP